MINTLAYLFGAPVEKKKNDFETLAPKDCTIKMIVSDKHASLFVLASVRKKE